MMNNAEKVTADIAQWKAEGIEKAELMTMIGEDEIGWSYVWGSTGQLCTVANRKNKMGNPKIGSDDRDLIRKRCQVLNGSKSSCAGCKYYPDGKRTKIYDCIGFVNQLLNWAEIDHYGAGCSTMWNHDANWERKGELASMPETPCCVFQNYKGNRKKMQHIGFYDGKGNVFHCSKEVKKQKLSEYPWTDYAIPKGMGGVIPPEPEPGPTPVKKPTIRRGDKGPYVKLCQDDLLKLGYDVGPKGADNIFGKNTEAAVKKFQQEHNDIDGKPLKVDGIVGPKSWGAIDDAIGKIGI